MLNYCKKCVMPDTKPDLYFDEEGVCSACKFYDDRQSIDWSQRKLELEKILKNYRDVEGKNWDCIVPVSGGKDKLSSKPLSQSGSINSSIK